MLVTIVIPCYRQGRYLAQAIESCLAQTHSSIQIIVVDDGSDDDTAAVAQRFGPRIEYVHRHNGGLAAARNTGIALARGHAIKFLDADDHLAIEQLAWQAAGLGDRSDAISTTTIRTYREEAPDHIVDLPPPVERLLPDLLRSPDYGIHGFLFPLALVRRVDGFDESLKFAEDWEFLCRLGRHRPTVLRDDRIGAYYRLRIDSMSGDKRGMVETVAGLLVRMHDEWKSGPDAEWFGGDLLDCEIRTYQRLLVGGFGDEALRRALLNRILALRARLGGAADGWKFAALCRLIGYPAAERARSSVVGFRQRLFH